jgi:multidrug efflux pump
VRGGACRAKYAGAPTTTTLEDQGIIFTQVTLPPGATREETARTMDRVRDHVAAVFDNSGYGFVGQGQNVGIAFIRMKDWSERKGAENSVPAIVARANAAFKKIRVGQAFAFSPPAALELGNACRRFP